MEIRFSKILHVSSELTPEKQEKVRKKLESTDAALNKVYWAKVKGRLLESFSGL